MRANGHNGNSGGCSISCGTWFSYLSTCRTRRCCGSRIWVGGSGRCGLGLRYEISVPAGFMSLDRLAYSLRY